MYNKARTKSVKPSAVSDFRTLLVFQVAGQHYGVPASIVQRIVSMAELHRPPGIPKVFAGFLNLAGEPIPVICLSQLFGLPHAPVDLWTPLVVVQIAASRFALLVDEVHQVLKVERGAVLPLMPGHVLNDCVEGIVQRQLAPSVLLLSAERLLLQEEVETVAALQELMRERLCEVEGLHA